MHTQPILGVDKNYHSVMKLPRSLTTIETFGFSLCGLLGWFSSAPVITYGLGIQALWVWIPATIIGLMLCFQVQALGKQWPDVAGGTANYTSRLLENFPFLGRYAALGYFVGWAAFPLSSIILTELIKAQLEPWGVSCPEMPMKIVFTLILFSVAFSGTRTLAILHLCFIIPAVGLVLLFSIQGISWLAFSPQSNGFFPNSLPSFSVVEWPKWFIFAVYAVYPLETGVAFIADSQQPRQTLSLLSVVACLMPIISLGGSWVLICLASNSEFGGDTFKTFFAASPFWGQSASFIVTLLISSNSLLSAAIGIVNTPRILYQLALDGHLSPVFTVVSRQGVLKPGLAFTFVFGVYYLMWSNLNSLVMMITVSYLLCIIMFHFGLWLNRGQPGIRWPWLSLGFCLLEAFALIVGGLAWNWRDLVAGLLSPLLILVADAAIRRIAFPPFHLQWWVQRRQFDSVKIKDFVGFQVGILVALICTAATIAWVIKDNLQKLPGDIDDNLLAIVLMILSFMGVAIACWTTLPQIASIAEAREIAESRFINALDTVLDTILVLDETGAIAQANAAAEVLLTIDTNQLIGHHLNDFLLELDDVPAYWQNRSEQIFNHPQTGKRIIEITISQRMIRQRQEYIVFLRDISDRKQVEEQLRYSQATLLQQATELKQTLQNLQRTQSQLIQTEKMSSLGQLVAGVAHEINNPVNFIHGNLAHIDHYTQDLINLIQLYQESCINTTPELQNLISEIDLDFLIEDMPKTISSMKIGTQRIREIVLTLRNFSRLDEAEMKFVNIHEGIDSTLLILQNRLKAKPEHAAIEICKEYGQLPEIECYAGQLNQVFMNILSNAIDALDKHNQERTTAEIQNKPSQIKICTQVLDNNWVAISIQDNGLGMTESVKQKLFDPFFTTKPVGQGTGLGLSISYQIVVDKHNGKIECISEPGGGAEFKIEIPIRQSSYSNPNLLTIFKQ
ncbi:MAG: PAS domain S-box protein [Desmonostoc vinosum HA7617-LM4]|jgi:PAS domain S-box-containing protein|nr:PAS domain S-box protein [Desmonostoc vinosum HA7617-LM4]